MKKWLKAYAIYFAGALAVVVYALWVSRKTAGVSISQLIGASANGHVPVDADELPV